MTKPAKDKRVRFDMRMPAALRGRLDRAIPEGQRTAFVQEALEIALDAWESQAAPKAPSNETPRKPT